MRKRFYFLNWKFVPFPFFLREKPASTARCYFHGMPARTSQKPSKNSRVTQLSGFVACAILGISFFYLPECTTHAAASSRSATCWRAITLETESRHCSAPDSPSAATPAAYILGLHRQRPLVDVIPCRVGGTLDVCLRGTGFSILYCGETAGARRAIGRRVKGRIRWKLAQF